MSTLARAFVIAIVAAASAACGSLIPSNGRGRYPHALPPREDTSIPVIALTDADCTASGKVLLQGTKTPRCVALPKAMPLDELDAAAFASTAQDARCDAILATFNAYLAAREPTLGVSAFDCNESVMGIDLVGRVTFTLLRPDGAERYLRMLFREGDVLTLELSVVNGDGGQTLWDAARPQALIVDFAEGLNDLAPTLAAFMSAPATEAPTLFGEPYESAIERALKASPMVASHALAEGQKRRGTLTLSAELPDGLPFLGCADQACLDRDPIEWLARGPFLILVRRQLNGGAATLWTWSSSFSSSGAP